MALGRLRRKPQADSRGVNGLESLIDGRLIDLDRLPALVEVFLADAPARQELLAPFQVGLRQDQRRLPALVGRHVGAQVGDLGVNVLDRVLESEPIGPGLGHQAAHLGLSRREVRFGRLHGGLLDGDLNLVGFLVELDQQGSLLHTVVVVDQHPAHLALRPGEQRRSRGR